jgi:hypothetical protein
MQFLGTPSCSIEVQNHHTQPCPASVCPALRAIGAFDNDPPVSLLIVIIVVFFVIIIHLQAGLQPLVRRLLPSQPKCHITFD